MNAVQDGTINITHSDIPSFLYGAGTEYKEENQSNGPLQGYFLVRVSSISTLWAYDNNLFYRLGDTSLQTWHHS